METKRNPLHRRVSSEASEDGVRSWKEFNARIRAIQTSDLAVKVMARANPHKRGGHDPDVACQLLKPGRLHDNQVPLIRLESFRRLVLHSMQRQNISLVPDTVKFQEPGVDPREYTDHEIAAGFFH